MKRDSIAMLRTAFAYVPAVVGCMVVASTTFAAPISLTTLGSPYTQNFDTLAATGTVNTALPVGWALSEVGTSADSGYSAGTGSSNAGDTYSFGLTASAERAFGGLLSGSLTPVIGAGIVNNTGASIAALEIAFTGEQWRVGVTNRGAADRMDFQLSSDATSLTTGTWTDYDALDVLSPVILGTAGAVNGNVSANQTVLSFTITGLSLANGAELWIRWTDFNISGADDGLAVDDFSLTPQGVPEPATLGLLGAGLLGFGLARCKRGQVRASPKPRDAASCASL